MKYLNYPHDGCIGPQISSCICYKNEIDSFLIFLVMVLLSTLFVNMQYMINHWI